MPENEQQSTLDSFGEHLVKSVRRIALIQVRKLIRGEMKGAAGIRFKELFENFTPDQLASIDQATEFAIDSTLFNVLFSADSESLRILFPDNTGEYINIADLSDGLSGELSSDDGWITRFS